LIKNGLAEALASYGVSTISESDKDALCRIWDHLRPWPDAAQGLERIRQSGRMVATLSNFGIRTLEAISVHGGLAWNRILSSETVKRYKPDPAVYKMAVEKLDEEPAKIMMVAAHSYDLVAAEKIGFATAFVIRAGEDPPPASQEFDLVAADFNDLAIQINQKFSL
jgi:2-haloacid dehalogenase